MSTPAHWSDVFLQMISDCQRRREHLNDWERDFLTNMETRLHQHKKPTLAQTEKLEQIWERVTAEGFARVTN